MAGKWSEIKKKFARFEGDDPSWQGKVDKAKAAKPWTIDGKPVNKPLTGLTHVELAKLYADFRGRKDAIEAQLAKVNIVLEAISSCAVELLEDMDQPSFKVESLNNASFYTSYDIYTSPVDRAAVERYFLENDMTEFFSINWQRLNSFCKGQIEAQLAAGLNVKEKSQLNEKKEAGLELPPGIKIFIKASLRARGLNKKENTNGTTTE